MARYAIASNVQDRLERAVFTFVAAKEALSSRSPVFLTFNGDFHVYQTAVSLQEISSILSCVQSGVTLTQHSVALAMNCVHAV